MDGCSLTQSASYGPIAIAIYHALESYSAVAAKVMRDVCVDLAYLQDPAARLDGANVVARAHAKLIELLPLGDCSKAKVVSALNMSVRTLHNRLADSGTTYQQLLDSTRRELAEQNMRQANISVNEVAYLLGYSDCSNFSRAFHH
jgi:AraC-like DNA-binding protein